LGAQFPPCERKATPEACVQILTVFLAAVHHAAVHNPVRYSQANFSAVSILAERQKAFPASTRTRHVCLVDFRNRKKNNKKKLV